MDDHHHHQSSSMSWRMKAGLLVFAVIAGFYLWTEHRAHLLGWSPFLIFLLCPLMHFFMHGGHGHRSGGKETQNQDKGGKP
ncbi:MAG: DUF2933 domain-containing protein [Oxalobacter sp.]|nr:MAG: DUF2933 domain-containing protein [Oxalobacter sp.]